MKLINNTLLKELYNEPATKRLISSFKHRWMAKVGKLALDKTKAERCISKKYNQSHMLSPCCVFASSPLQAQLMAQGRDPYSCVSSTLYIRYSHIGDYFDTISDFFIKSSLRADLIVPLYDSLSPINRGVADTLEAEITQMQKQKQQYYNFSYSGNIGNYGWAAFYEFFRELGIVQNDDFDNFLELLDAGVYDMIQFEDLCIVVPHPVILHRNEQGQLHCDGGPAIAWEDGYSQWYLNGVAVSQELAETPAGLLDSDMFLKETNADVKAEFLKKYGVDRLASRGKVIDSYKNYDNLNQYWKDSEYELIDMAFMHERLDKALYLRMKNLSVPGTYHLEGVSNDCKTIHDAIRDRWEESEEYETIAIK